MLTYFIDEMKAKGWSFSFIDYKVCVQHSWIGSNKCKYYALPSLKVLLMYLWMYLKSNENICNDEHDKYKLI